MSVTKLVCVFVCIWLGSIVTVHADISVPPQYACRYESTIEDYAQKSKSFDRELLKCYDNVWVTWFGRNPKDFSIDFSNMYDNKISSSWYACRLRFLLQPEARLDCYVSSEF